jgi:hypothetical protein
VLAGGASSITGMIRSRLAGTAGFNASGVEFCCASARRPTSQAIALVLRMAAKASSPLFVLVRFACSRSSYALTCRAFEVYTLSASAGT